MKAVLEDTAPRASSRVPGAPGSVGVVPATPPAPSSPGEALPSLIREVSVGAPAGAVDLSLGVPGWPLPRPAREVLAECAAAVEPCGYGPNEGLPELVEAVAEQHLVTQDQVMIASGSQAALFALFQAYLRPGQRVLVPDPGFPSYENLARLRGADVLRYRLAADGGLDPEAFARALGRGGALLAVVNHPGNPTGGGASAEALAEVARACRRAGVLLLSDEVYRELALGPRQPSLHDVAPDGVVLSSVSKAWAAPGLRVGWAVGDPAVLAPARRVHAMMTTAPARPSQLAAAALLRHSTEVLADSRRELARRWTVVQTAPTAVRARTTPAGGFYHWLELPEWVEEPLAFCRRVRDEGLVTMVPGLAFGPSGARHVRLSCGGDPDRLATALQHLQRWWVAS